MPKKAASKKGSAAKKDGKNGDKPHWGHGRKGPRSQIWKGSLSFGLVSVAPLTAAVSSFLLTGGKARQPDAARA